MVSKKKKEQGVSIGKILSVCLMICCLTFLTSLNYFLYFSSDGEAITQNASPSGPTEEKSSSSSGFSIVEEILHEDSFLYNFKISNHLFLHHIAEAEKLQIFHPELILRPPRA